MTRSKKRGAEKRGRSGVCAPQSSTSNHHQIQDAVEISSSNSSVVSSSSLSHDDDIVIGETALDPVKAHCWSCFVSLQVDNNDERGSGRDAVSYYLMHEHPLLRVIVCSVCQDAAESVEKDILDKINNVTPTNGDNNDGDYSDYQSCSWCGQTEMDLNQSYPPLADDGENDLVLCDSCPRSFCQRCIVISMGGKKEALEEVRRACSHSDEQWECCHCRPSPFLKELQETYRSLLASGYPEHSGNEEVTDEDDSRISMLIDELNNVEDKFEDAQLKIEDEHIDQIRRKIKRELLSEGNYRVGSKELNSVVCEEVEAYRKLWQRTLERCSDTIGRLQDELESMNVSIESFYKFRTVEKGERREVGKELNPCWKKNAEQELARRDIQEGYTPGEFRGATGYKSTNPDIYKFEPEDLDPLFLKEIEDINTTEGAIIQMKSLLESHPDATKRWGSRCGTTKEDIEFFERKSIKFEEFILGDRIDFKELEKKSCIKDSDDAILDKEADMMMIRSDKNVGSVRLVKRNLTLQALRSHAKSELTSAHLSNITKEYQPRIPNNGIKTTVDGTVPESSQKPKKRAQFQTALRSDSDILHSTASNASMRGMLIGSDIPFENSDISLQVQSCSSKISVCKPLGLLLKNHQVEGVKFCWNNICSDIMKSDESIKGAILAHSMGMGKSIQTICIIHTLLTHPSLVSSTNGNVKRIVHKALLIAPVNTLANWEAEFRKWIGVSSGRKVPFIRFYSWENQVNKDKLIREWSDYGGVLCCSTGKYASTCNSIIEKDGSAKESSTNRTSEGDDFLRKALFNPGPDVVVLDEAHTMLKSHTSIIFKILKNMKTRLRLLLTGTPLQNNLVEYYRMATWTKPECLGSEISFINKYEKPIMDGMAADCSPAEASKQEELSTELHKILSATIHRCDKEVLKKELPFKQEAVIHVRQSKIQIKLYREFCKYRKQNDVNFFEQYHALRPVNNHPACLTLEARGAFCNSSTDTETFKDQEKILPNIAPEKYAWMCDKCQTAKFRTLEDAIEHENTCDGKFDADENSPLDKTEWWRSFLDRIQISGRNIKAINNGGKIMILLQIIAHCDLIGEKVVVFSQCLKTLNFIEEVLQTPDWGGFNAGIPNNTKKFGGWRKNNEYLRIDGSVNAKERGELVDAFNTIDIERSKLFLISTKAGGLGINLVAANRVVLMDTHWNPVISEQAIHRCYRFGQTKPVYCYRLLAEGSMEEKIFSRAAAKTSLSNLVIDQRNIERLFSKREMDLLQANDTWVQCERCDKWRMLHPETPEDEILNLPDKWYCKDNKRDPDRSMCDAPEEDNDWYISRWSASTEETRPEAVNVSQPLNEQNLETCIRRDVVLQTLLSLYEGKSKSNERKTMSWISKYTFSKDTLESAENARSVLKTSPRKRNLSSPKKEQKRNSFEEQYIDNKSPSRQTRKGLLSEENEESLNKISEKYADSGQKRKATQGCVDFIPVHKKKVNAISNNQRNTSATQEISHYHSPEKFHDKSVKYVAHLNEPIPRKRVSNIQKNRVLLSQSSPISLSSKASHDSERIQKNSKNNSSYLKTLMRRNNIIDRQKANQRSLQLTCLNNIPKKIGAAYPVKGDTIDLCSDSDIG